MIITLTGFMGSGKSTIGSILAEQTGMEFVDLDEQIVQRTGKTVSQWFSDGEEAFRSAESRVLAGVLAEAEHGASTVLSLGGGTMLREENRRLIREHSTCIWLQASPITLRSRLGLPQISEESTDSETITSNRPLLQTKPIEELLSERLRLYEDVSDFAIETDGFTPEEIVKEIIAAI